MPKSVSTRSAYKMLTCIYLCRTLLFFAPYADFYIKNRRKIRKKAAQVERKCHFKRRLCNYNIHTLPLGMLTLPLLQIVIIVLSITSLLKFHGTTG